MKIRGRVLLLLMIVTASHVSQLKADDAVKRIEDFLTDVVSKQDRSLLDDESALLSALSISDPSDYREFVERMFKSRDYTEALVLKHVWIVLARNDRSSSAIAASSILLESDDAKVTNFMPEIMSDADTPPRRDSQWDFSNYELTLETVGWSDSMRLLSYMFEHSPAAGLESVIKVFGDEIPTASQIAFIERAWAIEKGLRKPGGMIVGKERLNEFYSFAESLLDSDSELFAPYLSAVLRRENLRNVSPELRERLEGISSLARSFFSEDIERSIFPTLEAPIFDELVSLSKSSGE